MCTQSALAWVWSALATDAAAQGVHVGELTGGKPHTVDVYADSTTVGKTLRSFTVDAHSGEDMTCDEFNVTITTTDGPHVIATIDDTATSR